MDNAAINARAQEMKNLNKAQVIAEGGSALGSGSSPFNSIESAFARVNSLAQANSARSAEEARVLREWQEQQNAKAMAFNASEAAKNRDWQEYMSNTAHQREIADLKAAGLNPVLSAMGGNGAAVTSGATAAGVTSAGAKGEVDTSVNQAITNLLGSMINFMGNLEVANTNAKTSERNADLMAEVNKFVALVAADASKYGADRSKYGVLDTALTALIDFLGNKDDNGKGTPDPSVLFSPEEVKKYGLPGSFERFLKSPLALFEKLFKKG